MIRIIAITAKILLTMITALLVISCGCESNVIKGSGNIISSNRPVTAEVTDIFVDRGITVDLLQGNTPKVTVRADDNLIQYVRVTQEGSTLQITTDKTGFFTTDNITVSVQLPNFERITASSGAEVSGTGSINTDKLILESSGGAEIELNVETDELIGEASSGAGIELSGKSLSVDLSVSSGSDADAERLLANDVRAQASSGGSINVQPILSLDARASSGGSIRYSRVPKRLTKLESSGGSISEN